MLLKGCIFLLVIAYASSEYITTYDCPNITTHSKDVLMKVSDCEASYERCPLYQGKSHKVTFEFVMLKNYTGKIDFRVYGVFEKFTVPYRGKSDAFENATYIDNGEKLKDVGIFLTNRPIMHNSVFIVSSSYPKINLKVRFMIVERRTKEALMCREVAVGIQSPPTEGNAD
ncbi:ML domain-containing protein [Nephila pilipes]|uniref:ML domain-containing protein n=1 Tax=Nephila pilipes TaxID=299642 RepID=A0A8X6P8R9_NEPPI|nr:ML domain-containing protein [Nephila pilipes]